MWNLYPESGPVAPPGFLSSRFDLSLWITPKVTTKKRSPLCYATPPTPAKILYLTHRLSGNSLNSVIQSLSRMMAGVGASTLSKGSKMDPLISSWKTLLSFLTADISRVVLRECSRNIYSFCSFRGWILKSFNNKVLFLCVCVFLTLWETWFSGGNNYRIHTCDSFEPWYISLELICISYSIGLFPPRRKSLFFRCDL